MRPDPVAEPADAERTLLAELQHRVRNTLAMTRLIARRSAETSESLDDYVRHLDGRLAALARLQNAILRDPMGGIDLGQLVSDEVLGAGLGTSERLQVDGPILLLHPRAAEPFALALHELMTNAVKFGALSRPDGRLRISWAVESRDDAMRQLVVEWIETGMPPIEPRREGFGTIVLRDMLKHQLAATTSLAYTPAGLNCRITIPLSARILPAVR